MHEIHPANSPQASTTNHYDTVDRLHKVGEHGIALVNFPVTQGIRTVAVDLLVITPTGCHVVVVVRTEAQGDLHTPKRGAWQVGDNDTPFGNQAMNPAKLALAARDMLAAVLSTHGEAAHHLISTLTPMVAINTKWMRLPGDAAYISADGVNVTTLNNLRRVGLINTGHDVRVHDAVAMLSMLGVPANLVPDEFVFAREGFQMPTDGSFSPPPTPYFTGQGAQAPRAPGVGGFMRNLVESSGDTNGIQSKWGKRANFGLAAFDQAKNLYEVQRERKRAEQALYAQQQPQSFEQPGPYPAQQPHPAQDYEQPYPTQAHPEPFLAQPPHPAPPHRVDPPTGEQYPAQAHPAQTTPGVADGQTQPEAHHGYPAPGYPATDTGFGAHPAPAPTAPHPRPLRAWDRTIIAVTITLWTLVFFAAIVGRFDLGITATVTNLYSLAMALAGIVVPLVYATQRMHIEAVLLNSAVAETEPPPTM